MYKNYPLSEGAIVGEACNLIQANLPDSLALHCEVMYSKLLSHEAVSAKVKTTVLTQRARADLVIAQRQKHDTEKFSAKYVIEVKRWKAGKRQIDSDLKRLAELRERHPNVQALMFLVSEAERPNRFVNEDGLTRTGRQQIPGSHGYFRVRRTLKAAPAFTKKHSAQYGCLIEVFGKPRLSFSRPTKPTFR